jgi:hypothetical protein
MLWHSVRCGAYLGHRLIPIRFILAGGVVLALFFGAGVIYKRGYNAAMIEMRLENAQKTIEAVRKVAAKESALRDELVKQQKESDDAKNNLLRQRDAVIASLRNRPERPASMPASAPDSVACTGTSLYRTDAEFLTGEAARADNLRIDLQACQRAYDQAVEVTKPYSRP